MRSSDLKRVLGGPILVLWLAVWPGSVRAGAAIDPNSPVRSEVIRRQIKESQIEPLYLSITSVSQTDLGALIASLNDLRVPVEAPAAAEAPSVSASEGASEERLEDTAAPAVAAASEPAGQPVQEVTEEPWLLEIDSLGRAVEPLSLADVLFGAGHTEPAERFYKQVIETISSSENSDWQWAMYQRANCLRGSDLKQAADLYEALVQTAPNSPWSAAAQAQLTVLNWYESKQAVVAKRFLNDPNRLP